jgi:hypothetical protein
MNQVDAARLPVWVLGTTACVGLVCLLLVSGAVLAIVLFRRSRGKGPNDVA